MSWKCSIKKNKEEEISEDDRTGVWTWHNYREIYKTYNTADKMLSVASCIQLQPDGSAHLNLFPALHPHMNITSMEICVAFVLYVGLTWFPCSVTYEHCSPSLNISACTWELWFCSSCTRLQRDIDGSFIMTPKASTAAAAVIRAAPQTKVS